MIRWNRWWVAAAAGLLPTAVPAAEGLKLGVRPAIYEDGRGTGLRRPEGVGCGDRRVAVADTGNGRILPFRVTEDRLVPEEAIRLPQIPYPIRVEVTSGGEFLVLDGKLLRIARVAAGGTFAGYVEPGDGADPGTWIPKSFRIDRRDRIHLLDVYQARVLILDPGGGIERRIGFPPEAGFVSDLTVDGGGTVYAIDTTGRRVWVARPGDSSFSGLTESLREDMAFPTAIAADRRGRLFLLDKSGAGVVILGSDGTFRGRQLSGGWGEGFLRHPAGLCFVDPGTLFIADRDNNRVQVFSVLE